MLIRSVRQRPGAELRLFAGLGHLFSPRRPDGSRPYGRLAPEVIAAVVDYLKR